MKIDEVTVEVSPTLSYTNYCVMVKVGRKRYPLVYLNRPKVISKESFCQVMEMIEVAGLDGFEFELEPEPAPKKKVTVTGK